MRIQPHRLAHHSRSALSRCRPSSPTKRTVARTKTQRTAKKQPYSRPARRYTEAGSLSRQSSPTSRKRSSSQENNSICSTQQQLLGSGSSQANQQASTAASSSSTSTSQFRRFTPFWI